jgi:hypothetical protein
MKERQILFNGDGVRGILEGRKAQTRRKLKVQPSLYKGAIWEFPWGAGCSGSYLPVMPGHATASACPFGKIGDQLYVRETFITGYHINEDGKPDSFDEHGNKKPETVFYRATGDIDYWDDGDGFRNVPWKASIHMPRWASRIQLEITNIRVERLQNITEEDATAEGCDLPAVEGMSFKFNARHNFRHAWDSIYKNWDQNPWVWVIEFKRVQAGSQ